jgi:hypothetical protein
MRAYIFVILAALSAAITSAQSVPPAIFADPPADSAHPAKMTVLHVPTHGVQINGIVYQPSGAGPHPTLVICHGLPGNEKISISRRPSDAQGGMPSLSIIAARGAAPARSVSARTSRMPTPCSLICVIRGTPRDSALTRIASPLPGTAWVDGSLCTPPRTITI